MELIDIESVFVPGGRLSQCMPVYELRPGQLEMALGIMKILSCSASDQPEGKKSETLVVEAETGIGKTLGYLVPAVLSGKRVVISTATLNLQDQILKKDIPLVEKVLERKVSVECIKGRENYLCLYKWYQYRSSPQLSLVDDPFMAGVDTWLQKTESGDKAELPWLGDNIEFWKRVSASAEQCLGGECPEQGNCFISLMRRRAGRADLWVVNHHLFFSDLVLRAKGHGEVLPRYEAVIFDEAHHLENTASLFFGITFSGYQTHGLLSDVELLLEDGFKHEMADKLLSASAELKKRLDEFYSVFPKNRGRFALLQLIEDISPSVWHDIVKRLREALHNFVSLLEGYSIYGEGWPGLENRGKTLLESLLNICLIEQAEKDGFIRWYESRERTVLLSATPLELDALLLDNLYTKVDAVIMCSATLTSAGSFSYISKRLALLESTLFQQFPSPFDYENRVMIYVPEDGFPSPVEDGFADSLANRVKEILNVTEGRALVLCTSIKSMEKLATFLENEVTFPVLVQGRESRNGLLEKFRKNTCSVLVAVASFWEGVDVSGESLSCVIIDKLPFDVPSDPVVQARIAKVNAEGGNSFFSFQLPRAIFTLKQGAGRLMRSATDRGIIAIMDVRLFSKGYGSRFLKSLPPAPVVRELKKLEKIL